MIDFKQWGLPADLVGSLTAVGFLQPTPIQIQAIPVILEGHDVLGSAQTGTGKTGAYSIPMIAKLLESDRGALIVTPTRELATQVHASIRQLLAFKNNIRTALLIGGEPMPKQISQLKANPRIVIGTPGRINDHLKRGLLKLHDTEFLVLDETDRMLDMGFGIQIDAILKFLPAKRQTLLFSATIPAGIARLAEKYLKQPKRIAIGQSNVVAVNITQHVVRISDADKYTRLLQEIDERQGSIIVFAKTKRSTEKLYEKLLRRELAVDYIHGDLRQQRRDRVIRSFRGAKFRILVATDIAARGLDVPHIEHVINYDLPQCPEDYIHRIGRTARAGAKGEAVCFISPADAGRWKDIQRLLDPEAAKQASANDRFPRERSGGRGKGNSGGYSGGNGKKSFFGRNKPRQDENRPRQGGEFRQDGYKPRQDDRPRQDGHKPRQDGYKPRQDDRPRQGGEFRQDGHKPRQDGYKPRQDDRPRQGGEFRQDGYKKPRQDDRPRQGDGHKPRQEGQRSSESSERRPFPKRQFDSKRRRTA